MPPTIKDFQTHFGFHSFPCTREIPVERVFRLPFISEAVDALVDVVNKRMCGAILGQAGGGKSTSLRQLVARLPEARFRTHYIKVTDLSKRDMCGEIAAVMGVASAGNYPTLVRRLQERFLSTHEADGVRPVLIIDDAHDMRPDVLGLLAVLTNFEMDSRLVVSIILAGQPPLRKILRREELEDIAGRLSHIATLRLLSREENRDFIKHRMTIAGSKTVPFDEHALEAIYEIGCGNMRATDKLSLKSLELAHRVGAKLADSNHVTEARKLLWP